MIVAGHPKRLFQNCEHKSGKLVLVQVPCQSTYVVRNLNSGLFISGSLVAH